jgi:uncharacterized membrane protein YqjE
MTAVANGVPAASPPPVGPTASPPPPDLATLFGELREETRILVGHEIELAKAELDEAKGHLIKGVVGYVAAGVLAVFAVVLLSIAAAWALAETMPAWAAFLVVGGVWLVIALGAFTVGRTAIRRFDPVPHRTITTLKEDARWVRTLTS